MAQTYSTIPEDERLDRSCSIDVDVIDKKTGRRAVLALAALAFAGSVITGRRFRAPPIRPIRPRRTGPGAQTRSRSSAAWSCLGQPLLLCRESLVSYMPLARIC